MDTFFDRLGELLRSLMRSDASLHTGYDARDPDMRAALEELDDYLNAGRSAGAGRRRFAEGAQGQAGEDRREAHDRQHRQGQPGQQRGQQQHQQQQQQRARPQPLPAESLRKDYANLEVPFAAPLEQVQRSYRRLLRQYHPDRFVRDAVKQQLATEITKRLNESFQNIRRHHREGPREG